MDWDTVPDHRYSFHQLRPEGHEQHQTSHSCPLVHMLHEEDWVDEQRGSPQCENSSQSSVVDLAHQLVLSEVLPGREVLHLEEMLLRVEVVLADHWERVASESSLRSSCEEASDQHQRKEEMNHFTQSLSHVVVRHELVNVLNQ